MSEADHGDGRSAHLPRDVAGMALLGFTLVLLLSVVTRNAADPITLLPWPASNWYQADPTVFPVAPRAQNACGSLGATISAILIDNLGLASALVIAGLGGITTALLVRGRMNAPVLRSLGGCVLLPASAGALSLWPVPIAGMPVVGNGGRMGALWSEYLLDHFAPAGAWILTLTAIAIGLLLVSDYALLAAGKRIVAGGKMVSAASLRRAGGVLPVRRRRQPFTDLEAPILVDGENEAPSTAVARPEGVAELPEDRLRDLPVKVRKPNRNETADAETEDEENLGDPSRVGLGTAAAGLAAAAGVAAAAMGLSRSNDDADDAEDETDEPFDDDSEYREVEYDDETHLIREDDPHDDVPEPRVKTKKQRATTEDENGLIGALIESSPTSADDYQLPGIELLTESDDVSYDEQLDEVRRKARILEQTFLNFGFNIRVVEIETGPVIAQYEIELEPGLRLSKITSLADDVAIGLRVPSVRIVAPIPGKNTVGIEVPNETRQVVRLRDVIDESRGQADKMNIPVFLGQDVSGNPMVVDLAKMPHLLIAGRTGTGKSVCLNAIICSVLMCCRPDEVRMLMIDPKMVELSGYGRLPHLMHPVITDMRKAEAILAWAVDKMEERYSLLAKVGVRHINSYNDLGRDEVMRRLEIDEDDEVADVPDRLPFIVIVADEMADLMMTAGKDVEQHIIRLAQKSRAVGIHLILATQKPTVDVITGLIKSNLPARLSFQVASKNDSRVVLDENGADKLLGNGDMLFLWPGTSTLIRGQGTYLSDDEIDSVCNHCSMTEQSFASELIDLKVKEDGEDVETATMDKIKSRDDLYDSAIEVVIREGRGSCSLLQRCLGIGYGRAAKLIDYMAEDGIVGDYNGSKAREVLLTMSQWQAMQGLEVDDAEEGDPEASDSETVSSENVTAVYSPPFDTDDEYEDYE